MTTATIVSRDSKPAIAILLAVILALGLGLGLGLGRAGARRIANVSEPDDGGAEGDGGLGQ